MNRLAIPSLLLAMLSPAVMAADNVPDSGGIQDHGGSLTLAQGGSGDLGVFLGLKLWTNSWNIPWLTRVLTIPNPANPSSAVFQDTLSMYQSTTRTVLIPVVGLRQGDVVLSASYFPKTGYEAASNSGVSTHRTEFDITAGYYVVPPILLSVAYKGARTDALSSEGGNEHIQALLFGETGSFPVAGHWSVYENFAYGVARDTSDHSDAAGNTSWSARYQIGEIGVSYAWPRAGAGHFPASVVASAGYRFQSYTVQNIALGAFSPASPTANPLSISNVDARINTEGVILSVVAVF